MKKQVKKRPAPPVKAGKTKAKPRVKPAPKKPPPKKKRPAPPPSAAAILAEKQEGLYGEAIRLFYAQKYDRADALFRKIMQGPDRTLAHHAQVHSNICAGRLRQPQVYLRTVEDHYNYAVTMMNARKLEEATQHLETALRLAPQADHIHYAMAATQALRGNPEGAYQRLKTAIELEPGNRQRARADADFLGILGYPPLVALLRLDR